MDAGTGTNLTAQVQSAMQKEQIAMTVSRYVEVTNHFFQQLGTVIVIGEIAQVSYRNHYYFNIKDEKASVDCILFSGIASKIAFQPKSGQKVIITAYNSLYAKSGRFSLIVKEMELAGLGQIMEQLRLLEQRLEQEGVFAACQRPLPRVIGRVALITSLEGLVRFDFANNALRRNPMLEITIFETRVQGPDAPQALVYTLDFVYRHAASMGFDVIVLARGGGSFEDLLCFSDEQVVRMVARSPVPIISAIGHHDDCPLCDLAADLRVSTPTAAAEVVTPITRNDMLLRLRSLVDAADNAILRELDERSLRLEQINYRLEHSQLMLKLHNYHAQITMLCNKLDQLIYERFASSFQHVITLERRLAEHGLQERLARYESRLSQCVLKLDYVPQRLAHYGQILNSNMRLLQHSQALNTRLERSELQLGSLVARLNQQLSQRLETMEQRLTQAQRQLEIYPVPSTAKVTRLLPSGELAEPMVSEEEAEVMLGISPLPSFFATTLTHHAQERINAALNKLTEIPAKLSQKQQQFLNLEQSLFQVYDHNLQPVFTQRNLKLIELTSKMESLNPLYQLKRGLSLTTKDGTHTAKFEEIAVGDELITIMQGGTVRSKVEAVEPRTIDIPAMIHSAGSKTETSALAKAD